jgi:endoglycosylceramidase
MEQSLGPKDLENLKNWGVNLVRLGIFWEALEGTKGVYDEKYLDGVEQVINSLG